MCSFIIFILFSVVHQVASIVSSLASMGWAMASYHRSIRLAQQNKFNIGVMGTVLQFLWHFCITGIYSTVKSIPTGILKKLIDYH